MKDKETFEELRPLRRGDKVLRVRRRRPRRRLRMAWEAIFRFLKQVGR